MDFVDEEDVAPFTGAWIEIRQVAGMRGLMADVAPFTGAWIEMHVAGRPLGVPYSRTLHGCVD